MLTYEHNTLRLFGFPVFTLVVGVLFVAALVGLVYGVSRRRLVQGKLALVASSCVLLLFSLAIALVCYTVITGSMQ